MFFKGSRYFNIPEEEIADGQGRPIRYKRVRFVTGATVRAEHTVAPDERLDHIAHRYYRDPERFWRICDANGALWPDDLVATPGTRLGIPGNED